MVLRSGLSEQVYDVLKERIIDGVLAPGQRLNIDKLAGEIGVSNIPVREALARLSAEKLIYQEPYKGYTVMPMLTLERLHQLFDTRLLIETHAVRLAVPRMSDADLQHMRDLVLRVESLRVGPTYQQFKAFTVSDHEFHCMIVAGSGNLVLAELYESLGAHMQLCRLYRDRGSVNAEQGAQEHYAILQAFEAHDSDAAVNAIAAHIEEARRYLAVSLQKRQECVAVAAGIS